MNGLEFKKIRENLGLNQEELSEVLCLSGKKVISNIERDVRNPSLLTIVLMHLLSSLPQGKSKEFQKLILSFREKELRTKRRRQ